MNHFLCLALSLHFDICFHHKAYTGPNNYSASLVSYLFRYLGHLNTFLTHPSNLITSGELRGEVLFTLFNIQFMNHLFFLISCFLTQLEWHPLQCVLMINYQSFPQSILHLPTYLHVYLSPLFIILFLQSLCSIWILEVLNKCWLNLKESLFKLLLNITLVLSKKGVEPSLHPCMEFPSIFQVQFCSKRKAYPGFIKN